MLSLIKALGTFLDTFDELHAFIMGWSEAIYPRVSRFRFSIEEENPVHKEYWYYSLGLAVGTLTWAGIIIIVVVLIILLT